MGDARTDLREGRARWRDGCGPAPTATPARAVRPLLPAASPASRRQCFPGNHAKAELIGGGAGALPGALLGGHVRGRAERSHRSRWRGHRVTAASSPRSSDDAASMARANPKSVTRTRPSLPTSTLSGLKSRCTRPAACAAARPAAGADATASSTLAPANAACSANCAGSRRRPAPCARKTRALPSPASCTGDDVGVRQLRQRLGLAHNRRAPRFRPARPQQLERNLALEHVGRRPRRPRPCRRRPRRLPRGSGRASYQGRSSRAIVTDVSLALPRELAEQGPAPRDAIEVRLDGGALAAAQLPGDIERREIVVNTPRRAPQFWKTCPRRGLRSNRFSDGDTI